MRVLKLEREHGARKVENRLEISYKTFMKILKVSVIIPVYNEEKTVLDVLNKVLQQSVVSGISFEIIVVDDASTDATASLVTRYQTDRPEGVIRYLKQNKNQGKGAALKRGFLEASGDVVLVQDADLEYDPSDYPKLLDPIEKDKADVVFGTRFRGEYQRVLYFWHYLGNTTLTLLSNIFTNLNLSDMETGYKVFKREVIQAIAPKLKSKRFGIEPELTARVAHGHWRIYEVPINYHGRTYQEGKKIGWRDGFKAIGAILYFNLIDR